MSLLCISIIIGAAGAFGGLLNAVQLTYRGSSTVDVAANTGPATSYGPRKWFRDFGYCILLGFAAGVLSWSLYGPYTLENVFQNQPQTQTPRLFDLPLGTLGTAVIVGLGGSRWLTNEVDKKLLQAAVVDASRKPGNAELSAKLIDASPEQVRNLAANAS